MALERGQEADGQEGGDTLREGWWKPTRNVQEASVPSAGFMGSAGCSCVQHSRVVTRSMK